MKAKITFHEKSKAPLTGDHVVEFKGGIEKKKNRANAVLALAALLVLSPESLESAGFEIEFLKANSSKKPVEKKRTKKAESAAVAPITPSILDPYTLDRRRPAPPSAKELQPGQTWVRRNTCSTVTLEMVPELHPNGPGKIMSDGEAAGYTGVYWDFVSASGATRVETEPSTPALNIVASRRV